MAYIDISIHGFLARRDLPLVVLLLQQVLPAAAATPRQEIASSRSSLNEEIDKFHFEEEETEGLK